MRKKLLFGQLARELRVEKRITLREFSISSGIDPSYWSKVERGREVPPSSVCFLLNVAKNLNLDLKSKEAAYFIGIGCIESLYNREDYELTEEEKEKELIKRLPMFPHSPSGGKISKEELYSLVERIRENL